LTDAETAKRLILVVRKRLILVVRKRLILVVRKRLILVVRKRLILVAGIVFSVAIVAAARTVHLMANQKPPLKRLMLEPEFDC
jgi:hypothetical protein